MPIAAEETLIVVYSICLDGLSAEDANTIRDAISLAGPVDFRFLSPGSFEAIFEGDTTSIGRANDLAHKLRKLATDHAISSIGVSVEHGPCIVQRSPVGGFSFFPAGDTVSRAIKMAHAEASAG